MKTTTSIIALTLCIITPTLAACLFADQMFSPEIIFGSYTIVGLLLIAATDYKPRRVLAFPRSVVGKHGRWTRRSLVRGDRFGRFIRAKKIAV